MKRNYDLSFLGFYQKEKAIPLIINLLKKEGYDVDETNVKSWSQLRMDYNDVVRSVNRIKSIKKCIVFTNQVPFKESLSKDSGITILDVNDIEDVAIKHRQFGELCDLFHTNDYNI